MLKKIALILGSIVAIYTFLGFVVLPFLAKKYIPKFFLQTYHLETKLQEVAFNPYSFELHLKQFKIYQKHKRKRLLSFDQLYIDLDPVKLLKKQIYISLIDLQKAFVFLDLHNGSLNLSKIFSSKKAEKKDSDPLAYAVIIDNIEIHNSDIKLHIIEGKTHDTFYFNDLSFDLENYSTTSQQPIPFKLFTKIDHQSPLKIAGKFVLKNPFGFDAQIDTEHIDLVKLLALTDQNLHLDLQSAELSLHTRVQFHKKKFSASKIALDIKRFDLKSKQQKPIMKFDAFVMKDGSYEGEKNSFTCKQIIVQKPVLHLVRDKDGSFFLAKLFGSDKNSTKQSQKSFFYAIEKVILDNGSILFDDLKVNKKFIVKQMNLKVENISSNPLEKSSFLFTSKVDKTPIRSQGSYMLKPLLQLQSSLNIKNLEVSQFSPYIEENSYIALTKGSITLDANISYQKDTSKPDLSMMGDLYIKDIALQDTKEQKEFFGANTIDMKQFRVELFPNRAYVNKIDIDTMFVFTHITQSKKLNLLELAKTSQKKKKTQEKAFPYAIGNILIKDSSAIFVDDSLQIPFRTKVHTLNGKILALSNNAKEISYIALNGVVNKYGSLKIEGNFQSNDPKEFLDTKLEFRNLDLKRFSGYMLEYMGYKIENGKLFVHLKYKIENGKLHSKNRFMLRNIELQSTKNVNTKIPLSLALALLEDNNGVIELEIPVDGDVNDPSFHYTRVIQQSLEDILKKVISSPFYLVADLVGLDQKELSYVGFEAGSIKLLPSQKEKLDKLALFLKKRSKIVLALIPTYDIDKDRYTLAQKQLIQKLLNQSEENNQQRSTNALALDLIKALYLQYYSEVSLKKIDISLKKKYKENENVYNIELRKKLFALLVEKEKVTKRSLESLALQRAQMIQRYLIQKEISQQQIKIEKKILPLNEDGEFVKLKLSLENN